MRSVCIIIFLLVSIAIISPNTFSSQLSVEGEESHNLIYATSNGTITVGSYFIYNCTFTNRQFRFNFTIIAMNDTYVTFVRQGYEYTNPNNNWTEIFTWNASRGIFPFWVYPDLAIKFIEKLNETSSIKYYVSYNDEWFNFTYRVYNWTNETDLIRESAQHFNEYYVVDLQISAFYEVEKHSRTNLRNYNVSKLIEFWSPNLNNTQGSNQTSEEKSTNETHRGFWAWVRYYISLGIFTIGMIAIIVFFVKEINKVESQEVKLRR